MPALLTVLLRECCQPVLPAKLAAAHLPCTLRMFMKLSASPVWRCNPEIFLRIRLFASLPAPCLLGSLIFGLRCWELPRRPGHFCSKTGEGITVHCQKAPSAVKLVNAFLLQFGLDCFWGSIAVAHNCPSLPHRDAANCPLSHNLSIAIGRFQGGGLVVESDHGDRTLIDPATELPVPAMLMDSCHKPVLFSPLKLREPWQGDRWSLTHTASVPCPTWTQVLRVTWCSWDSRYLLKSCSVVSLSSAN